jgi:steroid delta-isomerase
MALTADQITTAVHTYIEAVGAGDPDKLGALFAEDAVQEDPVGNVNNGRDAIIEFFGNIKDVKKEASLKSLRVAGDVAVFEFSMITYAGDQKFLLEPIDVMRFDENGLIKSVVAVWSQEDLKVI